MSAKFITGVFFGIMLSIFLAAGAGYYFFLTTVPGDQVPAALVKNPDKVAGMLKAGEGSSGLVDFLFTLTVPPLLKESMPKRYNLLAQLNPSDPKQFNGFGIGMPINGRGDHKYRFQFPEKLTPGVYRLSVFLCSDGTKVCEQQRAQLEARFFFNYSKDRPGEVSLGEVPLSRVHALSASCYGSASLLSGIVEATPAFLAAAPKKKLALVLLSNRNSQNVPPGLTSTGANEVFYQYAPPLEQYLLYAGPLEAKQEGFSFTAPAVAGFQGQILAFAVECEGDEAYKTCAERVHPVPANINSVPGRVYRLLGKALVVPRCGMKDFHLYLHKFPPAGAADPAQASLPPEFVPGAIY